MSTTVLDATGLICPLPVLRAAKSLKELGPGDVLEVRATDADAPGDFEALCEATGSTFLDCTETGGTFVIRICKQD